jgi:hypothetical protein
MRKIYRNRRAIKGECRPAGSPLFLGELAAAKIPNSKSQTPKKLQTPNFNVRQRCHQSGLRVRTAGQDFGVLIVEFISGLRFGAWSF